MMHLPIWKKASGRANWEAMWDMLGDVQCGWKVTECGMKSIHKDGNTSTKVDGKVHECFRMHMEMGQEWCHNSYSFCL